METSLSLTPAAEVVTDALIVLGFENGKPPAETPAAAAVTELYNSGEFTGEKFAVTVLHRPEGLKAGRLALAGCGKAEKFTPAVLREVTAAAVRNLRSKAVKKFALLLDEKRRKPEFVRAAIEGAILGAYDPDRYQTDKAKKEKKKVDSFAVVAPGGGADLGTAVEQGRIVADCQNFARDLIYEPGNRLTPAALARRAQEMAADAGLECEVLDRDRMRQLGMGALLGVAQGSAEPPVLIVLRYRPEQAAGETHLGLVGKGVTFDAGGISIKPAEKMDEMKSDMSGGATMLGVMRAVARLKPPMPVTALVPAVENMPGGRAQRPGDIVTTLSGKTVEVLNTDAEGRLILIDALTYAQRLGCTHLIDAATLTGAIMVALGNVNTGVFASNQELLDKLLAAARAEGEKMWPMPLDEEYTDQLKSTFADLPNIGPRWGGAITAACFLKEFADPLPWAHLDIAGTAWLDKDKPFLAKGPTGVGVRSLVRLVMDW